MGKARGFDAVNTDLIAGLEGDTYESFCRTVDNMVELAPENITIHTLTVKRAADLAGREDRSGLADRDTAAKMVSYGYEKLKKSGYEPYYMYRQKYMRGNLENVGYALPGKECVYNIDMMEDTTSIMAHGAGAMTKCIYDAERRVERVPNPKDIATYIAKIDRLAEEKRRLYEIR